MTLEEFKNDYDWNEVFKYGKPTVCKSHNHINPSNVLGSGVSTEPFGIDDVESIIAISSGKEDELDWVGVFLLKDQRFCSISAWCDFTGWG